MTKTERERLIKELREVAKEMQTLACELERGGYDNPLKFISLNSIKDTLELRKEGKKHDECNVRQEFFLNDLSTEVLEKDIIDKEIASKKLHERMAKITKYRELKDK